MPEQLTFKVENAQIIFRNFAGNETPFNREGKRNFGVILDPEFAETLLADGWNVKFLEAREPGEEDTPWISVEVNFKNRPPKIVTITESGRTNIDEKTVSSLDWANVKGVDLICNAYNWVIAEGTPQEKRGVKAYLKTMFVIIEEDDLERKYSSMGQQ